jgi:Fe-S-cluster containining protein
MDDARAEPDVVALLEHAITCVGEVTHAGDARLDEAMDTLDAYLATLTERTGAPLRCTAGCATCCTDAPPVFAVEARRIADALGKRGWARVREAAALLATMPDDPSDPEYRSAQLEHRARGLPCPALDPDQRCGVYSKRPLACRVYAAIEHPDHCDPSHPRYATAERPPRWATPAEHELERALVELGTRLGYGSRVAPLALAVAAHAD